MHVVRSHNLKVNRRQASIRRYILAHPDVDVWLLQEAHQYRAALESIPGFTLHMPSGRAPGAILVRSNLAQFGEAPLRMQRTWRRPRMPGQHPPRIFPVVTVEDIRYVSVHIPERRSWIVPARVECYARLYALLSDGRPTLLGGDWNGKPGERGPGLPAAFIEDHGLKVAPTGRIDFFAGQGVRITDVDVLDKYGSNHAAIQCQVALDTIALRVDGVDISHHQAEPLDMPAGKAAGVRFVYHKATEGVTFRDPSYPARRFEAAAAGLPFGAYHFASPDGGDALAEARAFLAYAAPEPGDLLPVLDLEVNPGGLTRAELTRWVGVFVREVERVVGVKPMIYTPFDMDDSHGCLLWVARYNPANEPPRIPQPWTRYHLRQFSNGELGVPDWVAGFGAVDLNYLPDDVPLRRLLIPEEPPVADDRYERVQWRGKTFDRYTMEALKVAERRLGYELTVHQGSYNTSVGASAGTHAGGGAVDLAPYDAARKLRVLKNIGFAAWYRPALPGVWGPHIHAILIGNAKMSPQAAAQVTAYRNGRDGLAGNGPDPSYRPNPIPTFVYPQRLNRVQRAQEALTDAAERLDVAAASLAKVSADRTAVHQQLPVLAGVAASLDDVRESLPEK